MNICSLSIKNLKKNFAFYSLYLLSVSFVLIVFFAFTSFSMNKIMLEKISTDGRVEKMCTGISIFLMAFVIFYMAYSNRFFLRRRMKELGIYTLLGYRKTTVLQLLEATKSTFPQKGITVSFDCIKNVYLVAPYHLIVYRFIKGLLINVYKHSDASHVWITLLQKKEEIKLSVCDNGSTNAANIDMADNVVYNGIFQSWNK